MSFQCCSASVSVNPWDHTPQHFEWTPKAAISFSFWSNPGVLVSCKSLPPHLGQPLSVVPGTRVSVPTGNSVVVTFPDVWQMGVTVKFSWTSTWGSDPQLR